jgi:NAD(P)-dependent dehydrogenase (short-subunit alcohol dehydrogenase family)
VAQAIKNAGGKAEAVAVDVINKLSVEAMVKTCLQTFGKVDILINNAGINRDTLVMRMKEEQWDQVIDVNLKGTFFCSQAVIKPMMHSGGRIVNTSSVASLGNMGQANYSASKGGVISLTRTLALELIRYHINVNCVAPGTVKTAMFDSVPDDLKEKYREYIPMKRFAEPLEIAYAHLFFCSEESDYITGQTLFVDGGISVGL